MNDDLWATYAKGVKKLSSKKDEPPPQDRSLLPPTEPEQPKTEFEKMVDDTPALLVEAKREEDHSLPPTPKPRQPQFLDVRIERNLSLGDVVIEAKCDLHGLTEQEAHETFLTFIEKQDHLHKRLLLIVTGKGKDGQSVLKKNLPRWCEVSPLNDKILAIRTAAAHHGGEGAYYVLLRKR